jgi:hypothetical protein
MSLPQSKNAKRERCRRKFLRFFRKGFYDQKYIDWERGYKWAAHEEWQEKLGREKFGALLESGSYGEVAAQAARIESRTNLLFSFEKMAFRDAVKSEDGARTFAQALYGFLYGVASADKRFAAYAQSLGKLPVRQTRVLTWPLLTVFGFIAEPTSHIFLKPRVTQAAAEAYDFDFHYKSKPSWDTYFSLLSFANQIKKDFPDLKPRDYIDLQSFIWVMGSDEYD